MLEEGAVQSTCLVPSTSATPPNRIPSSVEVSRRLRDYRFMLVLQNQIHQRMVLWRKPRIHFKTNRVPLTYGVMGLQNFPHTIFGSVAA
jgi:hypothetical protein